MLRSPVTTGALSLISIFTAFQKVPNLFSFMLHSATSHNFSLFSNASLSFPPSKKKLDSQHSSHVLQIFVWDCGNKLTLFVTTSQSFSAAFLNLCFPALIPVVQVLEEACTVVFNNLECKSCGSLTQASGMRECRGMGYCCIFGFTWLLFEKGNQTWKTIRRECCGVNLKDVIVYLLLCGRRALCAA